MGKGLVPRPTQAELAILCVLWRRGPSTVREVWEQVSQTRRAGYTTILKIMQIMRNKGFVARRGDGRSHVYRAIRSEDLTQRQVVRHVLDLVFAGSSAKLVMQVVAARRAAPAELGEIRRVLDEVECR